MTIHSFISAHRLERFDTPQSLTAPQFFPPWLAESFEISEQLEVYADSSRAVWAVIAPRSNRFKVFRTDAVYFEGAIDSDYRQLEKL
jgi:hypothetical protein